RAHKKKTCKSHRVCANRRGGRARRPSSIRRSPSPSQTVSRVAGSHRRGSNLRSLVRAFVLLFAPLCALLAACRTSHEPGSTQGVVIGAVTPWPKAVVAAPNDPPRILAAQLSSNVIRVGDWWSGRVATTTNIAVVELRSPSFSFILH